MRKIFVLMSLLVLVACGEKDELENQSAPEAVKMKKATLSLEERVKTAPDGPYVEKFEDGKVEIEGTVAGGKREGTWKSFYPDGSPRSESAYTGGIRTGKTVAWYPNGVIHFIGYYEKGKQSGDWIYYNEDGTIDKEESFDK